MFTGLWPTTLFKLQNEWSKREPWYHSSPTLHHCDSNRDNSKIAGSLRLIVYTANLGGITGSDNLSSARGLQRRSSLLSGWPGGMSC